MRFPLQKTEELGIDRPTFIWALNLSYRGDRGATAEPGDLTSVYGTVPGRWLPMAAAARGAGLAEERDGRWRLLDRAFFAGAKATEPARRQHTPFALSYRADDPPAGSFAQLDAAIYGLWQVRDDCHMAAWRASSLSGPEVEVLTRAWREEAADEAALADLLPHQRPEDVTAAIARLRKDGLVERDRLSVTSAGASARQAIEDETDRLFFTPWPDEVGARSAWIAEKLIEINTALA